MKVLLVRLSAMGDILFASPLIRAFRDGGQDVRVSWLVAQPFASLLEDELLLDEVLVLPTADWRRLWKAGRLFALVKSVFAFCGELHRRNFDLAVDLQGLLKSGIWTWLSGARERVGLGSREGSQYLMHRVIDRHGGRHERIASEYLHLAESLGLEAGDFPMHVAIGETARAQAGERLAETVAEVPYGVICPFTTRPQKHWIESHWKTLVPLLRRRFGLQVVMLGGPGDVEAASGIASVGALDLVGKTSIQAAAAVIEGAAYVIGVDTGLTHMGLAFHRPTLCLFGSTRPYTDTATDTGRVIFHDMPCAPCKRRPTCHGRFDCMRAITPEQVADALDEVLAGASARASDASL